MTASSACRWGIETFFKNLETGCRIEDARLTSAHRPADLIALGRIVTQAASTG